MGTKTRTQNVVQQNPSSKALHTKHLLDLADEMAEMSEDEFRLTIAAFRSYRRAMLLDRAQEPK
ncbi:hypothetical protein GF380_04955 [Candidatus Uhrbacteria bacterium]|nr:hypothetical protein [Candidatus Uhrbacteria bacterium]MBD3284381.1 hypothetical protein [Candidatus Uhrbacteria bacterium]